MNLISFSEYRYICFVCALAQIKLGYSNSNLDLPMVGWTLRNSDNLSEEISNNLKLQQEMNVYSCI